MDIERRKLLAYAGGATASLTGIASAAEDPPIPNFAIQVPIVPFETLSVEDAPTSPSENEAAAWSELKKRLDDTGNWAKTFDTSFENGALADLKVIRSQEENQKTHNSRLVEPLLGDISALLERCLRYRDEGSGLEIQGVAAGVNKVVADSLRETDLELSLLDKSAEVAAILAANYPNAATQFSAALDQAVGKGTETVLKAEAQGHQVITASASRRAALSTARLKFVQGLERQLLSRHTVEGNAQNYAERFDFLRSLYLSDITAAYRRALAVQQGLASLFSFNEPVPDPAGTGFVESMILWTRKAMRAVTLVGETELEFERIINFGTTGNTLNVKDQFQGLKNIRLRSISAAFMGESTLNETWTEASFGLVLVKSTQTLGPRVVVVLPEVRYFSSRITPPAVSGANLYNVDPVGEWSVRLMSRGISNTPGVGLNRDSTITQVILRMRVVATPDASNDGSWWTSADRL